MGSASVTYCYYSGSATGKTGAQMAWTKGYSGASIIQPDPSYGITNLQSSFSDGVLTCSFVRKGHTDIQPPGQNDSIGFDLSQPYYLLLAQGMIAKDMGPGKLCDVKMPLKAKFFLLHN